MTAKPEKCPLCGGKCEVIRDTGRCRGVTCLNADCLYWVSSAKLHRALSAKGKVGKVVARGYWCNASRHVLCLTGGRCRKANPGECHRVEVRRVVEEG